MSKKDEQIIKTLLIQAERHIKTELESQRHKEEEQAINCISNNPKYFYSFATRKTRRQSIGPLKKPNGELTEDPKEMAELLRLQYDSAFSDPMPNKRINNVSKFFEEEVIKADGINDIEFNLSDIKKAINELKTNSASGPDSWKAVFLKHCKDEVAEPLFMLWRNSLDTGQIPYILKTAKIIPIFKGGDKYLTKNYRPVAFTSHFIKIIARVIRTKLYDHIEKRDLLNKNQHGFRKGLTCLSQLVEHQENIIAALEKNKNYDVIYTDFSKAFDKCDHGIIAHKLKSIGISGKIGQWIYNFLTNRKHVIKLQGVSSHESEVKSSVPQGTVLAPLLFIILLTDIDKNVQGSKVVSFADDTKISKELNCSHDKNILQKDVIEMYKWSKENNMHFNTEKFQLLRYGKDDELKQNEYSLPDGQLITESKQARDLGVIMTNDAKFSTHIKIASNKAKRNVGMILRSFQRRDKNIMLRLFKSLVIPILEYCSVLIAPYKQEDIIRLERIQRHFTANIEGMEHLNYEDRLKALDLYSLERRRERYIIIYVWKILGGLVPNIEGNQIKTKLNKSSRNGRSCNIPKLVVRQGECLTLREHSFPVRGPRLFNLMP